MALTKCSDCGSDVSTRAKACPRCGAPVEQPKLVDFSGCWKGLWWRLPLVIAICWVAHRIANWAMDNWAR